MTDGPRRVLVVCWGNSARSILAEALLRDLGGDRLEVHSAGIEPKGLNPLTLRALREAGLSTEGLRSTPVTDYVGQRFDSVITVCDEAREACPVFPGVHESLHWGHPDPAAARGTEEERMAAFRSVLAGLRAQVETFLAATPPSTAARTGGRSTGGAAPGTSA